MGSPIPIGVSTAWNARRHISGRAMVKELLDLGFECLELNVHVTPGMIEEVSDLVQENRVSIGSLHNYCPLPACNDLDRAAGAFPSLCAVNEAERNSAVLYTKQTIDWAVRVHATVVVVHSGHVPMKVHQREALELIKAGERDKAKELLMNDLLTRSAHRTPYLENLMTSLKEIAPYAEDHEVKLGLENRYFCSEIPTLDEFQMLFKNANSSALGYWHDTGHAHVMEVLGIASQEDWLKKYGSRLFGIHVHDAVGMTDHQAVGMGDIDFARVMSYADSSTRIVLEVHDQASPAELIASREKLSELLREQCSVVSGQ